MSVVTKLWVFLWVCGFTWIFLGAVLRNRESGWAVFFGMFVVTAVGQYFFRCPRCRWPIISIPRAPLMTWLPGDNCRRCGANFSDLANRQSNKKGHPK